MDAEVFGGSFCQRPNNRNKKYFSHVVGLNTTVGTVGRQPFIVNKLAHIQKTVSQKNQLTLTFKKRIFTQIGGARGIQTLRGIG